MIEQVIAPSCVVPASPARPLVSHPARTERARVLRRVIRAADAFFRGDSTWLARSLTRLSPERGGQYTASPVKRALDVALSVPALLVAIPMIASLVILNRLIEPRHPAFYLQDRVGNNGRPLRVVKMRSLHPRARHHTEARALTRFGRFMRVHYLDELPQLAQVAAGRLSLVGIRVLPANVYEGLAGSWSPQRYAAWREIYGTTRLGLSGVHQVLRKNGKEDARRFWRDVFYARHASLGLDLYLMWRTLGTRDR